MSTKLFRVEWAIDILAYSPQHAAEIAKKIQQDPESIANVFKIIEENGQESEIDLDSQQYLISKIEELKHSMYCLECGDDMLFSNTNGNLPQYEALRKELTKCQEKLDELRE